MTEIIKLDHSQRMVSVAFGITEESKIRIKNVCMFMTGSTSEFIEALWNNDELKLNEKLYSIYKYGMFIARKEE